MEYKVLISLGSNKGNRLDTITKAIQLLKKDIGDVIAISPVYETASWGYQDDAYLNNAICLVTKLAPLYIMEALLSIELKLGRERNSDIETYQARSIDLDIILIEGLVVDHPKLQVPHPRMNVRKFVLQPLVDIAPNWVHEKDELPLCDLLRKCEDDSAIDLYGVIPL
jgi:2-amino-4-hydroxy-6-hydroxymethyldihydropteridine diphosphokinase